MSKLRFIILLTFALPSLVFGQSVFFDFNTPGQLSNNFALSFGGLIPPYTYIENNGVGIAGSRAVDFNQPAGGTDSTAVFTNATYDFSASGAVLNASMMVKIKAPSNNNRPLQIGFLNRPSTFPSASVGERLTAFMSARINATAQPALTFTLQSQSKVNVGTATIDGTSGAATTLVAGNWYKLSTTFTNTKATIADTYVVAATVQDMGANGTTPGAIVMTQAPLTVTNASMINDSSVYFAFRGLDNAGADVYENISISQNNNATSITSGPANRTVVQGQGTAFYATVDGVPPTSYQWLKNGTPIPGATDWYYAIRSVALADAGDYALQINGSTTSTAGTLTVTPDTTPPALMSAGSFDGNTVGLCFDELLDPATAGNPANYTVSGATVVGATLRPDGKTVALTLGAPISGAFTVQVTGVKDRFNNTLATASTAGNVQTLLTSVDINNPQPPGSIFSCKAGDFEITAGGADVWGTADQFRYTYQPVAGDFDVKVLVADEGLAYGAGGNVVKAGLNVRENLEAGAVTAHAIVMPPFPGLNRYETGARPTPGANTAGWGVDPAGDPVNQGNIAAYHPSNSWIRLRRVGNTFAAYSSSNGVTWTLLALTTLNMSTNVLVGMELTSRAQNFPATADFLNYGAFAGFPGALLGWETNTTPTSTNIQAGQTATFTVFATNDIAPNSEVLYAWQRSNGSGGFTNVSTGYVTGTNSYTLTTPALFTPDNGAQYRAIARITGANSITSDVATVTVSDAAAPTLSSAAIPTGSTRNIILVFSEPLTVASATTAANYTVTNSLGAAVPVTSAALLGGDPRSVILTVANDLTAGSYGVVVNNVQDLGGNTIAANTTRTATQLGTPPTAPIVVEWFTALQNTPGDISTLTNNIKFIAGTPDLVTYSNVFGVNHSVAAFPDTINHYGVRMFSYFVPPTNGAYTFYIRGDDYVQLLMNTNAVGSTNPAGATLQRALTGNNPNYTAPNSVTNTLVAGQPYYIEFRFKETTGGDGGTLQVRNDATVPAATEVAPGSLFAFPSGVAGPTPVVAELYTGQVTSAPGGNGTIGDLIASTNTTSYIAKIPNVSGYERYFGFNTNLVQLQTTFDNYLGRLYTYFVAPSNGLYKFWMRSDDSSQLWMNTNAANSTDPGGRTLIGQLTAFTGNYTLVASNIALNAGQVYYLEGLWRDGTGGDGISLAVRSQSDNTTPPNTEVMPASFLVFPTNLARIGPVQLAGVTPVNPTTSVGRSITFTAVGVGGAGPYGITWLRDGQVVSVGTTTYTTPALTTADNGGVITLVVTNAFSRAEASSILGVVSDSTPPTVAAIEGQPLGDGVKIGFSEPLNAASSQNPANYLVSGGVTVLSAFLDATGTNVFLRTSQQTAGTRYTVTMSGIRDVAGNLIAPGTTAAFTAWIASGCGLLVDLWTGIGGTPIVNLTADNRFINNVPSNRGYAGSFGFGTSGTVTNNFMGFTMDNYGARLLGYFVAPSNGNYRFYLRSDDASQLFMNTNAANSMDQAGKTLLINVPSANLGYANAAAVSPMVTLVAGQMYYMEALMKEGGGGDYVTMAFRGTDGAGTPIGGVPADTEIASGTFFKPPGNPDNVQLNFASTPPATLTVRDGTTNTLVVNASVQPTMLTPTLCYHWQRAPSNSVTFTNIPGATSSNYSFVSSPSDNGASYRVLVSAAGTNGTSFTTVMGVTPNLAPVGGTDAAEVFQDTLLALPIAKLLMNDSDPEGDPLSISAATTPSVSGATVAISGTNINYMPATNFTGNDSFTYTLRDSRGATSLVTVTVRVRSINEPSRNMVSLTRVGNNYRLVTFAGIPGRTYYVQAAPVVTGPYVTISTNVAAANGLLSYLDAEEPVPPSRFYRTSVNP